MEFLGLLAVFQKRYTPGELPYHIIAPSLPGYTLSSGPPLTRDFEVEDVARIMDKLMVGLGFGGGYVAQGGDVGSFTCCPLAAKHDACKGTLLPTKMTLMTLTLSPAAVHGKCFQRP